VAGSPKTINVTYTIAPAPTVTPSAGFFNFQVAAGATPASQSLGMTSPAGAIPWSSQIAYTSGATGWLSLSQPSGTLPATVTVNATSMPVGVYKATITLFSGLGQPTVVPVSLAVNALGVNFVAPYIGTTSVAGNVIIRGYGFSGLTVPQVLFGATSAAAITPVSDTEIKASYPALLAGAYPITVKDGTTTLPSRAQLVVVDAPAYVATSIARPQTGFMASLIYDAERQSLYLIDLDHDVLERYKFDGANWVGSTAPGGGGTNRRMALSPDGTELVRVNFNSISRINPATLGTLSADVDAVPFFHSFTGPSGPVPEFSMIAFGNDGGAIGATQSSTVGLVSLYRYDMLTQDFTALSTQFNFGNAMTFAPADGSSVILPSFTSFLSGDPLSIFNPGDGTLATTSLVTQQAELASLSRTGSRIALTNKVFTQQQLTTVYDNSFTALGTLPDSPLGPSTLAGVVISPDGSTAYAYFSGSPGTVRKFDLNSPSNGGFTEIGSGTAPPDFPGTNLIEMTISPDGGTLFLAGSQKVIVMPAP
jgi:hypothetical protein